MTRAQQVAQQRARALAAMAADPDDPRHGRATGYTYGCRCDACFAAGQRQTHRQFLSGSRRISRSRIVG